MKNSESPAKGVPSVFRSGNPAGQKPVKGAKIFSAEMRHPPTELDRARMAEALGCPLDAVPDYFETFLHQLAWMIKMAATRGNWDAIREILDREVPKPRRVELSGPGGGPLRSAVTSAQPTSEEAAAAQAYYEALAAQDDEEDA